MAQSPEYDHNEYGCGQWEFDPQLDLKLSPGWILDGVHSLPPLDPAGIYWWACLATDAWNWAENALSAPYNYGAVWRSYRGCVYMSVHNIDDEDEVKRREPKFKESMRPYLEDFQKIYESRKLELGKLYAEYRQVDFDKLDDVKLIDNFEGLENLAVKMWKWHFLDLHAACNIINMFADLCGELIGIDMDSPLFLRLLQGFPNEVLQCDTDLEKLSGRAIELGLKDTFTTGAIVASEVMPKLQASRDGKKWLEEFNEFMDKHGWNRMPGLPRLTSPCWIEDPSPALNIVKNNIVEEKTGGTLLAARKVAKDDRKRAEEEVLSKVPEARREEFKVIMRSAQASHTFMDEHDCFYDFGIFLLVRLLLMATGRRMVNYGCLDEAADIVYLLPNEIRKSFLPRFNIAPVARKRKQIQQIYTNEEKPLTLGEPSPEQAIGRMVQSRDGILTTLVVGPLPKARPELKADLQGVPASLGVAEGPARVVMNETELKDIRKGEILVAPTTTVTWTWAFGLIGGVVVDHGGVASHTAIVAREYRIPAVVNAFVATTTIRSGQKIRVDGTNGAVYIL